MPRQNRKQAYEDAKKQADAAGLCVADVVKVLAFDEAALTVDVQPITRYPDEDTFQTKPPVLAVPVATIYGGGFVIRPVYRPGTSAWWSTWTGTVTPLSLEVRRQTPTPSACTAGMMLSLWAASAPAATPYPASPPGP